ncbi:MAG: PQQ-dependent sugar dehydrogenase, partial [Planctomycetaceae bacterium]|nr:PQQ-dependent sugar dehydrogenase [Planctomycetaceae bacterium]
MEYTVARTFANVALQGPLYVVKEPGSERLLAIVSTIGDATASQVLLLPGDPESSATEVLLELPGRILYSLAFHPAFAENGHVYIFSNGPPEKRRNRITRYTIPPGERRIPPASEVVLLEWRSLGHDGGDLFFGPEGFLYASTGDGTSDSDPWNAGQALDDLLGSILRIDVDRPSGERPYTVPADNPFVEVPHARPEVWAYGLRNPWRMSFDRPSGQIWVGDNGQDLWETAHLVHRGDNYGWSVYEGSHPFYPGRPRGPTPLVPPTIEHHHAEFRSLTGGVVYRGVEFPELDGVYIYGDYSSGRI